MRKRHSIEKAEWSETRENQYHKVWYLHLAIDSLKWMARCI